MRHTKGEGTGIFGPDIYNSEGVDYFGSPSGGLSRTLSDPIDILSVDVILPDEQIFNVDRLKKAIQNRLDAGDDEGVNYYQKILDSYLLGVNEAQTRYQLLKRGQVTTSYYRVKCPKGHWNFITPSTIAMSPVEHSGEIKCKKCKQWFRPRKFKPVSLADKVMKKASVRKRHVRGQSLEVYRLLGRDNIAHGIDYERGVGNLKSIISEGLNPGSQVGTQATEYPIILVFTKDSLRPLKEISHRPGDFFTGRPAKPITIVSNLEEHFDDRRDADEVLNAMNAYIDVLEKNNYFEGVKSDLEYYERGMEDPTMRGLWKEWEEADEYGGFSLKDANNEILDAAQNIPVYKAVVNLDGNIVHIAPLERQGKTKKKKRHKVPNPIRRNYDYGESSTKADEDMKKINKYSIYNKWNEIEEAFLLRYSKLDDPKYYPDVDLQFTVQEQAVINKLAVVADELEIDVYLAGGFLRDKILGRPVKDIDAVTSSDVVAYAKRLVDKYKLEEPVIGERAKSIMLVIDDVSVDLINANVVLKPMIDLEGEDELNAIAFNDSYRRDLTINSLLYNIRSGELMDFNGAIDAMRRRQIMTVFNPLTKYRMAPLDMIRAVRFAAVLDFYIDDRVLNAMKIHKELLTPRSRGGDISNRSLKRELRKCLETHESVKRALRYFNETGILEVIRPEVADVLQDRELMDLLIEEDLRRTLSRHAAEKKKKKQKFGSHPSPDIDSLVSSWLYKNILLSEGREPEFLVIGDDDEAQSDDIIALDMGEGEYDHHQYIGLCNECNTFLEERGVCKGCGKNYDEYRDYVLLSATWRVANNHDLFDDEYLGPLVYLATMVDNAQILGCELHDANFIKMSRNFSEKYGEDNEKMYDVGHRILDQMYKYQSQFDTTPIIEANEDDELVKELKELIKVGRDKDEKARAKLEKGEEFEIMLPVFFGEPVNVKGIAVKFEKDESVVNVREYAYDAGYNVCVSCIDENNDLHFSVDGRLNLPDYTVEDLFEKVKETEPNKNAEWYLHSSKKLFLCGGGKRDIDDSQRAKLTFEELMDIVKNYQPPVYENDESIVYDTSNFLTEEDLLLAAEGKGPLMDGTISLVVTEPGESKGVDLKEFFSKKARLFTMKECQEAGQKALEELSEREKIKEKLMAKIPSKLPDDDFLFKNEDFSNEGETYIKEAQMNNNEGAAIFTPLGVSTEEIPGGDDRNTFLQEKSRIMQKRRLRDNYKKRLEALNE